ncbi:MAG: galactokinase, partial [Legionellales bacterium]|nr:galactokinase [Legionellales bacterium]
TGLGSSGSFTVSLLAALYSHYGKEIDRAELARIACDIEINKLGYFVGKQDPYISAIGGINSFIFHKNHDVEIQKLDLLPDTLKFLDNNLLIFFTGITREASNILQVQVKHSIESNAEMLENLHTTKKIGYQCIEALQKEDYIFFAKLMNTHWQNKLSRSPSMSNEIINNVYKKAMNNGALGGKLIGAGGGGFLMFYTTDNKKLRNLMNNLGLKELNFSFDNNGTTIIEK